MVGDASEKREPTAEGNLAMVYHYVGHGLLNARFSLEEGDVDGAEVARQKAITDLEKIGGTEGYIDLLRQANWRTTDGVADFDTKYEQIYTREREALRVQNVESVVASLFDRKKAE